VLFGSLAKPAAEESLHYLPVRASVPGPLGDHGHPVLEDHARALGQTQSA